MHAQTMPPIAVSILVFGDNTPGGARLREYMRQNNDKFHDVIDVRTILPRDLVRRKAYKVSHWENADALTTQLNLLRDPKFFDAAQMLTETIQKKSVDNQGKVFPVCCSAGAHRCDGVAKCASNRV